MKYVSEIVNRFSFNLHIPNIYLSAYLNGKKIQFSLNIEIKIHCLNAFNIYIYIFKKVHIYSTNKIYFSKYISWPLFVYFYNIFK